MAAKHSFVFLAAGVLGLSAAGEVSSHQQPGSVVRQHLLREDEKKNVDDPSRALSPACMEAICGKVADNPPYDASFERKTAEVAKRGATEYPQAIAPKIARLLKVNGEMLAMVRTKAKKYLEGPAFEIPAAYRPFYNMIDASVSMVAAEYELKEVDGKDVIAVKEEETRKKLAHLSKEEQDYQLRIMRFMLDMSRESRKASIDTYPPRIYLGMMNPGKSVEEAFQLELDSAREALREMAKKDPFRYQFMIMTVDESRIEIAQARLKDKTITEDDMRAVMLMNDEIRMMKPLLSGDKTPLTERAIPASSDLIKKAGGVEKMLKTLESYMGSLSIKKQTDECLGRFLLNSEILPDTADRKRLVDETNRSKDLVRKRVLSKYSEQTRKTLGEVLDKLSFLMPPTKEEFQASFERSLDSQIRKEESKLHGFEKMAETDQKALMLLAAISGSRSAEAKPEEAKDAPKDTNELCDDFQYEPMSDASYSGLGAIRLSFSTATGSEASRQMTITHEIGHAISLPMRTGKGSEQSTKRFHEVRACLWKQHTEPLPAETKKLMATPGTDGKPLEGIYNEEDFADGVAAQAHADGWKSNPWCSFLVSEQQDRYWPMGLPAFDLDEHSSGIYRLLHFNHLMKKETPKQCVAFLDKAGAKPAFTNCLETK